MKKILLLFLMLMGVTAYAAKEKAPKWMKKEAKAVVKITTYDAANNKLAEGLGFFVTDDGRLLTGYSLFNGASRAVVSNSEGVEYRVSRIQGADDMYDVICCHVEVPKKVPFLPIAQTPLTKDAKVYMMLPAAGKELKYKTGTITEVTKLKENYNYYQTSIPLDVQELNAPYLNEEGEVVGFAQTDAGGNKEISYAVSAAYTASLRVSGTDIFSSTYTKIAIRKVWPESKDEALIGLYLMAGKQKASDFEETLNDFIAHFPQSSEAYESRASLYALRRMELDSTDAEKNKYLDKAKADMNEALKLSAKKSDALFSSAKLIYNVALTDTTLTDSYWSVANAETLLKQAISENNLPVYHQLEGDMYLNKKEYQKAFDSYMILNNSESASAESYYWAAIAKENISDSDKKEVMTLLDSAVVKSTNIDDAVRYVLHRIDLRQELKQYLQLVADYNLYYKLMRGQVNDAFFFFREQAKSRIGDLEGALADIHNAILMNQNDAEYRAEEASLYVRKEQYEKALESVEKALQLQPEYAACYRLKGLCLVRLKRNSEACPCFDKAIALGDPIAGKMKKEYCGK